MGTIEHWPLVILVCDRCGEVYEDEQGCDCGVAAGRPQRVEVVPASQLRGAVEDRDALLTFIHTNLHRPATPPEICDLCAALTKQLPSTTGGE